MDKSYGKRGYIFGTAYTARPRLIRNTAHPDNRAKVTGLQHWRLYSVGTEMGLIEEPVEAQKDTTLLFPTHGMTC
jgi:hypothetical protein